MIRVLCDVDGVVLDFVAHVVRSANLPIAPDDITDPDFVDKLEQRHRDMIDNPLWWSELQPMPGAEAGFESLMLYETNIEWFWTSSPWVGCFGWESVRRAQLQAFFGTREDQFNSVKHKHIIAGDVFIDDKPEKIEAWARAHPEGTALLYDAPYNRNFPWPNRVSWEPTMRDVVPLAQMLRLLAIQDKQVRVTQPTTDTTQWPYRGGE